MLWRWVAASGGLHLCWSAKRDTSFWLRQVDGEVIAQLFITYEWSDWFALRCTLSQRSFLPTSQLALLYAKCPDPRGQAECAGMVDSERERSAGAPAEGPLQVHKQQHSAALSATPFRF